MSLFENPKIQESGAPLPRARKFVSDLNNRKTIHRNQNVYEKPSG